MSDELEKPTTSDTGAAVLAVLSAAMFVYVIDTTLMNVSISALVEDLDTTVGQVQAAITLYTLTMASFMLTGGKLGDIWGSKRAFRIGLIIYGIGTTITALAPTIGFVMFGWSILEGLGSALIVPAINTGFLGLMAEPGSQGVAAVFKSWHFVVGGNGRLISLAVICSSARIGLPVAMSVPFKARRRTSAGSMSFDIM